MSFGTPLNPQGFSNIQTSNWTSSSYTVPAGSNKRVVLIAGAHASNTTATTVSAATFDGSPLSERVNQMVGQWWFGVYDIVLGSATPTASFNIQLSNSRRVAAVAFTLEDCHQSDAPMISSVVSTLAHSLDSVPSGWLAIDALIDLGAEAAEPLVDSGQTLIFSEFAVNGGAERWACSSYTGTAGGTQSFNWTNATATSNTGHAILAYKPAAGGGGPTQESTPTDLEVTSIVAGPDSCDVTFDCASGGGSPTGLEYAVVVNSGDTPGAWNAILFADLPYTFSAAGSRVRNLKVRATGSLDPSTPAVVEFTTPDLVQENGDSATGLEKQSLDEAEVSVAVDATLGNAGIVEARWTGTAGNVVGEDVTINVIEADIPPEPGTWVIEIDGVEKTQTFLGNHVTPTGTWPCYSLGTLPDGSKAYMDLYNGNVDFCRVRIHRMAAYDAAGTHVPSAPISHKPYVVSINGDDTTVGVWNGAIGHVETVRPVTWTASALNAAVNAKRIMTGSVAAFSGWPRTPSTTPDSAPGNAPKTYVPGRSYGRGSSFNSIGVISGQGGEYTSSRGLVPGEEAQLLAAAWDGNTTMWSATVGWVEAQSYYAPTVPFLCIWSENHDTLRDPQFPFAGDQKYFNEGTSSQNLKDEGNWRVPYGYPYAADIGAFYTSIVSVTKANPCVVTYDGPLNPTSGQGIYIRDASGMTELSGSFSVGTVNTTAKTFVLRTTGGVNIDSTAWGTYTGGATGHSTLTHDRNEEHLFNHGFVWWLITGDPLAAITLQGIAAYTIGAVWQGGYGDGSYRSRFTAQRGTANFWSAMWRLRDVALNATGPNLWEPTRSTKIYNDCLDDWADQIDAVDAGTDATSVMLRLIGSLDGESGYGISNFMSQMYAVDAAYMWASAGRPKMMERLGRQMVTRFHGFGGTRGVYGTASGSALGLRAVSGGPIEYSDLAGMIAYVNANSSWINTSFAGGAQHTIHRAYWALKYAQDAVSRGWCSPIDDVDDAITTMETAKSVAPPDKDLSIVSWKHCLMDFTSAGVA